MSTLGEYFLQKKDSKGKNFSIALMQWLAISANISNKLVL